MNIREWSGKGWKVSIAGEVAFIEGSLAPVTVRGIDAAHLSLSRRWLRWSLEEDGEPLLRLRGIKNSGAQDLAAALRRLEFSEAVEEAANWYASLNRFLDERRQSQRWITTEETNQLTLGRPSQRLIDRLRTAGCYSLFAEDELVAVATLDSDVLDIVRSVNEQIMAAELSSRRPFFDAIEKSPLTDEQARAVICFDNRVQVLAAAGSGKTSVMVARAAYAVSRRLVSPERILLLAFNRAAAAELQERVAARFAEAGIDSSGIRASTFHSFGLDVIGRATGEKPRLASWLDQGRDVDMVLRIVDDLRESSGSFRRNWDLYRLLFANSPVDLEESNPDAYDKLSRRAGCKTFSGTVVKSHGERLIADFLYLNGVQFEYEKSYIYPTADAQHSQYRPDFYYPSIDVWHEHWALDRSGRAPKEFVGYSESMVWKRGVHAEHKTKLVESNWADVVFGNGLARLEAELTDLGLTFDWNPDRQIKDQWLQPMKHEDLARLVRAFMAHVKSNSWTRSNLESRLASELKHLDGFRSHLFLDLYWQIHEEWQKQLAENHSVDFEDMLVQAADHLKFGRAESSYELILVDEFQDASQARARLVQGLVRGPGRYLLAVGDDWQSINRFAGADISIMTRFEEWFGHGPQLALTSTFRCAQTICDVARTFVSRNPSQFTKPMRSASDDLAGFVTVVQSDDDADALASYLNELSSAINDGSILPGSSGTVSVDVLGRYRFQRSIIPSNAPPSLIVTFRTIHGSKGLEADYVVIPGVTTGMYGLPSSIADDPVLDIAMPIPESFPHAEERRLLYVALTRARRGVVIIAPINRMSPFAVELLGDPRVTIINEENSPVEVCAECGEGTMVLKSGPYGHFLACSAFPKCLNRRSLARK